jgi:hypothetical protein
VDYEHNVGRWLEDHPEFMLRIGAANYGYEARHRETGERYSALILDELDALLPVSSKT